ncbi:MAG: SRPBCC family protein [Rhizobium sp.]|nr:SRPBCC family protein [Rhizobium sp.]
MELSESSWHDALQNYSLWGLNDPNAPVKATVEMEVHATPQKVWDILCDVSSWPRMRPDIESVEVKEPVQTGTSCTLSTNGVKLVLTFGRMTVPHELNWVTTMPGLVMTNRYVLVPQAEGTRVVSSETITAPSFPQFTDAVLAERIKTWLVAVKAAAERINAASAAS